MVLCGEGVLECEVPPCLFNVYMDAVMKEVKMGIGRRGEDIAWPLLC